MAKQAQDLYTVDMLDKPKRGRPRKPDAMTDAQRAREYRKRQRAKRRGLSGGESETWHFPYSKAWCEYHGIPYVPQA